MLWAQRGRQYMTSNDNTLLDKIGALVTTGSHRAMANEAVRAPVLGGVTERLLDTQDDDAHMGHTHTTTKYLSHGVRVRNSMYVCMYVRRTHTTAAGQPRTKTLRGGLSVHPCTRFV